MSRARWKAHHKPGLKSLAALLFLASLVASQSFSDSADTHRQSAQQPGRSATGSEIATVEKYCADVQARIRKREPDFVLGFPSSNDENKAKWRKYASTTELKKASEGEILDEQAYVWAEGDKIFAANFTLQSGSGDWALYPNYCFHTNGTTAEISSELRTFYGGMVVRRDWKFDSNGRVLTSKEEFLDLETGRPKKPGEDFIDENIPQYHKISDLPFLSLLREPDRHP